MKKTIPILKPNPNFRVRRPDFTLPFGDPLPPTLPIASIYLLENIRTGEFYIGESGNLRSRLNAHRSYVISTGNIDSRSQFSKPVEVTDLVCHVWNLDLSDIRYRKLHEFLLAFFYETRNIGKAGYGRSELYGHTFVLPAKSEIHTFDIALFHQMYNIKPGKVKTQLRHLGITQHLALREEVFEAYEEVFSL